MQITINSDDPKFDEVVALIFGDETSVTTTETADEEAVDAYTNMAKPLLKKTIRSKGIMSRIKASLTEDELREILREHDAQTSDEDEDEEEAPPRKARKKKKQPEPEEDEEEEDEDEEEDDDDADDEADDDDDDEDDDDDDEDGVDLEVGMKLTATVRGQTVKNAKVLNIKEETGKIQVLNPKTKKKHWVSKDDCYV